MRRISEVTPSFAFPPAFSNQKGAMDQSIDPLLNHTARMGQQQMFSKEWYDEYFRRAEGSPTHSRFCERVYGIDLCQHGMMDGQGLDFLTSLIQPGERVLELGCSNGHITEYLQCGTAAEFLGIDYSDVAIEQALLRTEKKRKILDFRCVDLIHEEIPGQEYDLILAIDCLFFMGNYETILRKLKAKLAEEGRMILTTFQTKEEKDAGSLLQPAGTRLAQALRSSGFDFSFYDLTSNIRNHWMQNFHFAHELKNSFLAEGNRFLWEARTAENGWFRAHAENRTLVRFLYVVR